MGSTETKQTAIPVGGDVEAAESPPTTAAEKRQEILPRLFIGDILPDPQHWFTYS